jgi:hypothetical protein
MPSSTIFSISFYARPRSRTVRICPFGTCRWAWISVDDVYTRRNHASDRGERYTLGRWRYMEWLASAGLDERALATFR